MNHQIENVRFSNFVRVLVITVCLTFLIFISSFNFDNFTQGAHSYYASEIACSSSARERICKDTQQEDVRLFRGKVDEPKSVTDYGNRYTSETMAWFVTRFVDVGDTFREVILKVYIVKALIAAGLIAMLVQLAIKREYLRTFLFNQGTLVFSVPYILPGIAGVYPAPFAIISILGALSIMKIVNSEEIHSTNTKAILLSYFAVSSLFVFSNRFETSIYLGVAILLSLLDSLVSEKVGLNTKIKSFVFAIYVVIFGTFISFNSSFNEWFFGIFNGTSRVYTVSQAKESSVVNAIGDIGLSAMAPVTFFDNSTRNIARQFGDAFGDKMMTYGFSRNFLEIVGSLFVVLSWVPLVTILGVGAFHKFRVTRRGKFCSLKYFKKVLAPSVLLLLLIWVPYFARVSWFLWYVLPLLMILLFFFDQTRSHSWMRVIYVLPVFTNLIAFVASNFGFGSIFIADMELNWLTLLLLVSICMGVIYLQVIRLGRTRNLALE
jgi:hypothetical protein